MKNLLKQSIALIFFFWVTGYISAMAQEKQDELNETLNKLNYQMDNLNHQINQIEKAIDDIYWYNKIGDVAFIDKVYMYGPPLWKEKNPAAQGAGNPVKFRSYVFIPKNIDPEAKYPLIVFPHGGVHSNFNTYYAHIIRELMAQKYIVVAAEYRGSTGYGGSFYRKGIIGWSHGGLIALHNIFDHPENYKVAYAGVPVSDLIARMGYKTQNYRDLYSVDYHIGQTAYENVEEYKRRSPAWQAHKLQTPLLIHTNTNDADVNVLEVEHLIKSLKAEGKDFKYKIYQDVPGGHSFNRMDTRIAKEIRLEIYEFLDGYLDPPEKLETIQDLHKAAYVY